MTKNMWMNVPAGVLGQGGADARPCGAVDVRVAAQPPFAVRQGTGLPPTRLRPLGVQVDGTAVTGVTSSFIAQHNGTTLGFHTSSRPPS